MNGKRAKTKDNIDHEIPLIETLCKYLRVINNDQRDSPSSVEAERHDPESITSIDIHFSLFFQSFHRLN